MPHFVEKLIMLKNGTLKKPIDIFDLFYHTAPSILLIIKTLRDYSAKWNSNAMFIFLDTETTGTDEDDRLCQIAFKTEEGMSLN